MTIRVLLVDDVVEVRMLLRTALRFRGIFTVAGEAADGAQAIELAGALQPDIVVLDIGLPDLDGDDVLTQLRRRSPASKVIVFSGTEPQDSAELVSSVDGYAVKHRQLDYLIELLESVGHQPTLEASLVLPPSAASARHARVFTRETLIQWGRAELLDDALVIATELVSNAYVHARTNCRLRLSLSALSVRIEVFDQGPGTPNPLPPSQTRTHGRGLRLLAGLSTAWGVDAAPGGGKCVWAELVR